MGRRWRLTVPAVSGAAILNPNFGEPEIADRVGLFSRGAGPIAVRREGGESEPLR